jgi:hypothetical protein
MAWQFESVGTAAQVNAAAAQITGANATETALIALAVTAIATAITQLQTNDPSAVGFHAVCTGHATTHSAIKTITVDAVRLDKYGRIQSVADTHY